MNPNDPRTTKLPKWAQELIASQQQEITRLRGLPATLEKIPPDLLPPTRGWGQHLTRGWDHNIYFARQDRRDCRCVEQYCSSSVYHGYGWAKTSIQRPKTLYSTERLAWRALKAEFVHWAAERAAWIDERIEAASDELAPEYEK